MHGRYLKHNYIPGIWSVISNGNVCRPLCLTALVFVYDYHPGAETLLMRHFSGPDSTLAVGPDGTLLFPSNPRTGGIPNRHRPGGHRSPMPERLIWSYIIQLSSALRTVHASGLACRVIDPSKILLIGNSRWAFVCKPISRRSGLSSLLSSEKREFLFWFCFQLQIVSWALRILVS